MDFSFDRFYRLNRRAIIWIILFALIWLLRDFFLLIFLTFIITFFALPAAQWLMERLRLHRVVALSIVYSGILVGYIALVWWMTPRVLAEIDNVQGKLPGIVDKIEQRRLDFAEEYPGFASFLGLIDESYVPETGGILDLDEQRKTPGAAEQAAPALPPQRSSKAARLPPQPGESERGGFLNEKLREWKDGIAVILGRAATKIIGFGFTSLLAILFSFLIAFDYVRLAREVKSLKSSKLRDFYEEAGQPVVNFVLAVGRGFKSIAIIAFITALMIAVVLIVARIPQVFLLVVITFFTSLIPIVGVFFESVAILLVTFNEYGMNRTIGMFVAIMIVHAVIQYFVAPVIFGRQFRLNPVLVLIILYIGQKAFGMWGLILGVPVANYIIRDVFAVPIVEEKEAAEEKKKKEIAIKPEDAGGAAK